MSYKAALGPALYHTEDGCHQAAIVVKVIDADTANLVVFDEEAVPGRKLAAKLDCATGHYKSGCEPPPALPPPPTEAEPKPGDEDEEAPHKRGHHRKH